MSTAPDVVDKIKKLIALAEGQANSSESEAAAAAAVRLMTKHRIDAAMLRGATVEDELLNEAWTGFGAQYPWRLALAAILAKAHGAYFYVSVTESGGKFPWLCGEPESVTAVRYLYGFLSRAIPKHYAEHARRSGPSDTGMASFVGGFLSGLDSRLAKARKDVVVEKMRENDRPFAIERVHQALAVLEGAQDRARKRVLQGAEQIGQTTAAVKARKGSDFEAGQKAAEELDLDGRRLQAPLAGQIGRGES